MTTTNQPTGEPPQWHSEPTASINQNAPGHVAFSQNAALAAALALQDAVVFLRSTYTIAIATASAHLSGAAPSNGSAQQSLADVSQLLKLGLEQMNAVLDFGARVDGLTNQASGQQTPIG